MAIYQDLVDEYDFAHRYNSVKRFVATLKHRDPERFDVLESAPGEEAQVDFGQGAPTLAANGKYRRPHLFVMTLKYSGKSFRKVVWKADQETWARLHEEAFRAFCGSVSYVVLDNLKQGRDPPRSLRAAAQRGCMPPYWPTTAPWPIRRASGIPTARAPWRTRSSTPSRRR
ncbi:MAG: transposase [Gammaproteobacteria bacterium]|nr:transposase [Gammaproteobacteria bacterium]